MENKNESRFESIYKNKSWVLDDGDPLSGPGSRPDYCKEFVMWFNQFVVNNNLSSMVDYGCGDGMMWNGNLPKVNYHGIDLSPTALEEHEANTTSQFGITRSNDLHIPHADVILIKDVLIHLMDQNINELIEHIKANGFKYTVIVERDINNSVDCQYADYNRTEYLSYWGWCPIDITKFFDINQIETVEMPSLVADVFVIKN